MKDILLIAPLLACPLAMLAMGAVADRPTGSAALRSRRPAGADRQLNLLRCRRVQRCLPLGRQRAYQAATSCPGHSPVRTRSYSVSGARSAPPGHVTVPVSRSTLTFAKPS